MKVLVSAYVCVPGDGSEGGAGWAWAQAAAERHEVWLLTPSGNRPAIEVALRCEPNPSIHPVYVDVPDAMTRWRFTRRRTRTRYLTWQWSARRRAKALHDEHRLDVAHHVTFAADWMPAAVIGIRGLPGVWGPVGGTAPVPWRMVRWLGGRGVAYELARVMLCAPARATVGQFMSRRAALMVAQNADVARRFARARPIIEPNVAIDVEVRAPGSREARGTDSTLRAAFVGRLIPLKGLRLAIDALARPEARGWELTVLGSGPELEPARRRAERLGVDRRVEFEGHVSRARVFEVLEDADVLLFPSMHDAAAWSVAEAIAIGIPVIALDVGGPPVLIRRSGNGVLVPPDRNAPRLIAEALAAFATQTRVPPRRDTVATDRLADLVDSWYEQARSATADSRT